MKALKLKDGVFWVGAIDWNPPKFGYSLSKGTTYNSYVILDEKTALIDTVKHGFTQENISRINDATNTSDIDYVIIGNYHMDHSGSLPFLMKRAKNATILATKESKKAIEKYHGGEWNFEIVGDGDCLNLGKRKLLFTEFEISGNDILLTYSEHDNILFSEDLFSQNVASKDRLDSASEEQENDALSYFVNYLLPLQRLPDPDFNGIDILAPNHGVIWHQNTGKIIKKYQSWIKGESKNKATILYSSIWRGTEKMAYAIADGVSNTNIDTEVINYETCDPGYILTKLFESKTIVIGCPSLKGGVPPELSKIISLIELSGLKNKYLVLFSCYADMASPINHLLKLVSKIDFELIDNPLEVQYAPSEKELTLCFELGNRLGERTKNKKG
ncbi:MAG: FprA family A-type flavoprotein [Methanofastidiosum sp.]